MSILAAAGWFILGALAMGAITYFWDDIKNWLNNTAADVVQKYIGYDARRAMLHYRNSWMHQNVFIQ